MTITSKTAVRAIVDRFMAANPLAELPDGYEHAAAETGLSVEEVEAVVNEESESV